MNKTNEKADELIEKFANCELYDNHKAVLCAIILCDEVLKIQPLRSTKIAAKLDRYSESDSAEYWQDIKTELLSRKK